MTEWDDTPRHCEHCTQEYDLRGALCEMGDMPPHCERHRDKCERCGEMFCYRSLKENDVGEKLCEECVREEGERKMTFAKEIEEEAAGEVIEAAVIGGMGWGGDFRSERIPDYEKQVKNKVIPWEEASKFLDYEYDHGFGSPSCNCIYAWTKSRIIFVWQYDGSTRVASFPRNPIDCKPMMPGG